MKMSLNEIVLAYSLRVKKLVPYVTITNYNALSQFCRQCYTSCKLVGKSLINFLSLVIYFTKVVAKLC